MFTHPNAAVVRIVLEGDTYIVYNEISTLSWIVHLEAITEGDRSIWTIAIQGDRETPADLLRIVLADRRLQVIEYRLIRAPADDLDADHRTGE